MLSLIYAMGEEAEDIFQTFTFNNEGDKDNYNIVLGKFDKHFVPKRNAVHARAILHKHDQLPGDSVEQYMRCLHELIEHCDYGTDKHDHIRDRMAVGLLDAELKEKLQLLDECPLEKAIQLARQTERVKSRLAKQSSNEKQLEEVSHHRHRCGAAARQPEGRPRKEGKIGIIVTVSSAHGQCKTECKQAIIVESMAIPNI